MEYDPSFERVAGLVHDVWARWIRYQFSKCVAIPDGPDGTYSLKIPPELVDRWQRQMLTEYPDLSEEEKESDREIAAEYIKAVLHQAT